MKYPTIDEVIDMNGEPDDVPSVYGAKSKPPAILFKARVRGYTRKNGTFVREHEDGRPMAPHEVRHHEREAHLADVRGDLSAAQAEGDERMTGFYKEVLDHHQAEHEAITAAHAEFAKYGDGATFKHKKRDSWAALLPDATSPGKYRYQMFDQDGFYSHSTHDTPEDAVEDAVSNGFTVPDHDAADRVMGTRRFTFGNRKAAVIQALNSGKIGHVEAGQQLDAIHAEYTAGEMNKAIVPGYRRKGPSGIVVVRGYTNKVQARAKPAAEDHRTAQLFATAAAQAAQTAPGAERQRAPEHTGHRSLMDKELDAINFACRRYHLMSKEQFLAHLREHNARFEEARAKSPRGRTAARQRAADQFNAEDSADIHLRSVIAADQQGQRVSQLAQADYPHLFASVGQEIEVRGMRITVENPRGSTRSKTPRSGGATWHQVMVHHYGEFPDTKGADGDPIDVFVGPDHKASNVYIVNQHKKTGEFDEHKVLVGFPNRNAAMAGYLAHYPVGWTGARSVATMPVAIFKKWLASTDKSRPAADDNARHA